LIDKFVDYDNQSISLG